MNKDTVAPHVVNIIDATADPFALWQQWYARAQISEPSDANAAALATQGLDGMPDVRIILIKHTDTTGFTFFTNSHSSKGQQLAAHASAALCVHWKSTAQQVRVRGVVVPVPAEQSDEYFASRPRLSQLGAHASQQSQPLAQRGDLAQQLQQVTEQFANTPHVPRPPHWFGYCVRPLSIEFWHDAPYRLHDRVRFTRPSIDSTQWQGQRLCP